MSEKKSFIDDLVDAKPESFNEEVFVKTSRNYKPLIVIGILVMVVFLTAVFMYSISGAVIPDVTDWTTADIESWAKTNKLSPIMKGVYTMDIDKDKIITIDVEIGEKVRKSSTFTVSYSMGPDPTERIDLMDFKDKTIGEIQDFIDQYKLTGISITKEESEVIEKDYVIDFNIVDGTSESFMRKNRIKVYISTGANSLEDTFKMADFSGKTRGDVETWMAQKSITVLFSEAYNSSITYGLVSSQSIKANTKITRKDTIDIVISLGKPIDVPDFVGLTKEEAMELATYYEIKAFFRYKVSGQKDDVIISQDIEPNTQISQSELLTLYVSKDSDYQSVPDFLTLSLSEATSLASLYDLKLFTKEVDSVEKKDSIISQSITPGDSIISDTIITLLVSNGQIVIPDFTGLSKEEATLIGEANDITLLFNEIKTTSHPNNTIIDQSSNAGSAMNDGSTVICDLAINSNLIAKDLRDMTKEEAELWATTNDVTLHIIESYNDDYAMGVLYDQSVINQWIGVDDILTIRYSLGRVGITDFVGSTKIDVVTWLDEINLKGAQLTVNFAKDTSTESARGIVTEQSISSDYVRVGSTIVITVSATDNGVVIPDLTNMTLSELSSWCAENSVAYITTDAYSVKYDDGHIFNQNYTNKSLPDGKILRVKISIGKVYIGAYTSKADIIAWKSDVNSMGANIQLRSTGTGDTILSHSPINVYLDSLDELIDVEYN